MLNLTLRPALQTPPVGQTLEVNGHQLVRETPKPCFYFVTPHSAAGRADPILRCQVCREAWSSTSLFEKYACRGPARPLASD